MSIHTTIRCVLCDAIAVTTAAQVPVCAEHHAAYAQEARYYRPMNERPVYQRLLAVQAATLPIDQQDAHRERARALPLELTPTEEADLRAILKQWSKQPHTFVVPLKDDPPITTCRVSGEGPYYPFTVASLIATLQTLPPDAPVLTDGGVPVIAVKHGGIGEDLVWLFTDEAPQ